MPGLGKKIEAPPMPAPYVKVREGIYRNPEGKLETQIPTPPPPPRPTIYDFYGVPHE